MMQGWGCQEDYGLGYTAELRPTDHGEWRIGVNQELFVLLV